MMSPVTGDHRTSLSMVVLLCSVVVSSLLCLVCAQSDHCGASVVPLVTRGRPIIKGQYPWLAALYQVDEGGNWYQFCGGALLSPRIVLTAAHCLVIEREVIKPQNITVGLGKLYRDYYRNEDYAVIANVSQVVVHEGYHGSLSSFALDVGLLKLSTPVQMTDYILPVCIDLNTTIGSGAMVHAAGWGTSESGTSTDQALAIELSYLENHACLNKIREEYRRYVTHDKMCSLSINGSQVDRGYGGGPLTFHKDGRHFIVGVVSTKIMGQTSFSIFTDLLKPEIHSWLMEKTNLNSPDYYEHLFVVSVLGNYNARVRNSKEFVVTRMFSDDKLPPRSAVDCVTGTFYYWSHWDKMIKRQTVNGTDIEDIIPVDVTVEIKSMTVDWIDRKLYWIEKTIRGGVFRLKAASIHTKKVKTIIPRLPNNSTDLTIHPTLRKIYILNGNSNKTHSVDLDISTPEPTLFHEEVEGFMEDIAIDWENNDLCWLSFTDTKGKIKCKNLVTKTTRTVLSDHPTFSHYESLAISSHSYYWSNGSTINALSKSSSRVETFKHSDLVLGLHILREPCPTLNPAPRHSTTRKS